MNAFEWQKRLADAFHTEGIVGANLLPIMEAERLFDIAVETRFMGFATLNAAFQSFLLETISAADSVARNVGTRDPYKWYRPVLLSFVGVFKLFRAADRLFRSGYPLNGYALIRDLKDRALAYAAVMHGIATFEKVNGWDIAKVEAGEEYTWQHAQAARAARKKIDSLIFSTMLGKKSGFSDEVQHTLVQWSDMFHNEVHGGRLTFALEGAEWLSGQASIPVEPMAATKQISVAMFMNRFEEVAWLTLRTLCVLQPSTMPFSEAWRERWGILDDSFRVVHEEAIQLGRTGATAFSVFVATKFSFSPSSAFYNTAIP